MAQDIRITRIIRRTGEVAFQLHSLQFAGYRPPAETWSPNVNVVLFPDRIDVSIELAGVRVEDVRVEVAGRQLRVRGNRDVLGGGCGGASGCRVLVMEIDDGAFERVVPLPDRVVVRPEAMRAEQADGLLRIRIPLDA